MSDTDRVIDKPQKIKTPLAELELLAQLSDTEYFVVLKRLVRRYVENMKSLSFSLREEDPQFAIKHTRYVEQAVGMEMLIKAIADARIEKEAVHENEW